MMNAGLLVTLLLPMQSGDCKDAYQVGKDIQRLEGEIGDLKSALAELIELDRQKMALIQKLVGDEANIPAPRVRIDKATPPPPPATRAKRKTGAIAGNVEFLKDNRLAYVYVENVRGRLARGRKVKIAQKNRQFRPRWLVVQKGTTIDFPNQDGIYHNVFAKSQNASFDLGIYRKGDPTKSYTFTKPGLVDVYCNMHAKMSAEVLVVPNHLYTKVRPDGSFKLVRVPAGRRKIVAWGPGADLVSRFVDVQADGTAAVSLALRPRKKGKHTNKSGQPYGSYQ